jgi:ABC-2 type transport system ATP-binding protein
MQQKVQFVATVVHSPDLLVLDEPASGLDPVNQTVLIDALRAARAEGRTVVFSTHNMDQAEQLCDAVCIIAGGRKVLDGELREIRRGHRGNRWRVELEDPSPAAREWIGSRPWLAELAALGEPICLLERVRPSLHEIFVERVGDAAASPPRGEAAGG